MVFLYPVGQKTSVHQSWSQNIERKRGERQPAFSDFYADISPPDTLTIRFAGKVQVSDTEKEAQDFAKEWDAKVGHCLAQLREADFNFIWEANERNETALNQAEQKLWQTLSDSEANQKLKNLMLHQEEIQNPVLKKVLLVLKNFFNVRYPDNAEAFGVRKEAEITRNTLIKVAEQYTGEPGLLGQYVADDSPFSYAERCKRLVKVQNTYADLQAQSNGWDYGLEKPEAFNQLLDKAVPVLNEAQELSDRISRMDMLLVQGTRRTEPFRDPFLDPSERRRNLRFEDILEHEDPRYCSRVDGAAQIEDKGSKFIEGKPTYLEPQRVREYEQPTESGIHSPKVTLRTMIEKTADRWGFPVAGVLDNPKSRFYTDRDRKVDHCFLINPPKEVWVMVNIDGEACWQSGSGNGDKPPVSPMGYKVGHVLHEVALHGGTCSLINASLPYLLRRHGSVVAEGLGLMGNMLPMDLAWQKDVMQVSPKDLERLKPALARARVDALAALNIYLKNALAIRALYRDPEQDMDKLFYGLRKDLWRKQPSGAWAEKAFQVLDPQRYATYVISALWMAQVAEYLEEHFDGIYTKEAGQYLKEHLAQGYQYDWQESAIALTKKPLSVEPLRRLIRNTHADLITELKKMGPQNER